MKRILLTLALLALPLAAQQQKQAASPATVPQQKTGEPKQPPQAQKLFVLKYADTRQLAGLLRTGFGVTVNENAGMRALAVSASQGAMAAIEDAIKRLDVPSAAPQNIELMLYLMVGSQIDGPSSVPLPKELDSVVAQLKNAFAYKAYRLMDILTIRTRTGQSAEAKSSGGSIQFEGVNPGVPPSQTSVSTNFGVSSVSLGADGVIRIDGLRVSSTAGRNSASINTDVNTKEGQMLVVGKTGMTTKDALFLVLTAHVAQ
jgi:hypothetical protein